MYRDRQCVVAEFADFRRVLVDEVDGARQHAHRAVLEQRIVEARAQQRLQGRRARVDAADEHADAGGVAAADLEPVERRQRGLDAGEACGTKFLPR